MENQWASNDGPRNVSGLGSASSVWHLHRSIKSPVVNRVGPAEGAHGSPLLLTELSALQCFRSEPARKLLHRADSTQGLWGSRQRRSKRDPFQIAPLMHVVAEIRSNGSSVCERRAKPPDRDQPIAVVFFFFGKPVSPQCPALHHAQGLSQGALWHSKADIDGLKTWPGSRYFYPSAELILLMIKGASSILLSSCSCNTDDVWGHLVAFVGKLA